MIKKSVNKKIRNATPTVIDGIKFRSKLEAYTYKQLKESNIPFKHEANKYILVPSFEFKGKKIRPITLTPDFTGDFFIIESKGHPNDSFPMKWKMFQYYLLNNDMEHYDLYIVHNQKEVNEAIEQIKKTQL